ncbi:translesion DNA synthesis-associated protein ImuA [Methyloversatilis sp. XJ19-49]|uniref:translesion DNA synthesis-associated protein ImuA n=1 Tax=Methyloversatilis sp. XJ19-49 TaxID=2963429 RepID=UPI00211D1060|nr:translesion DNA synthesis-associated protein ImuA [Methyloversatilis sp. XJ19-49]MCQ9379428.1 translesion DNA synthesis-associated protein ImuA [Methyloversatilis sp. XJ19-49]
MTTQARGLFRHPSLWRAGDVSPTVPNGIPTGHAALDDALPGQGWPVGEMTELLTDCSGHGELSLLMPLLAGAETEGSWRVWVAPPHLPGVSALAAAGVRSRHLIVVRADTAGERVWAMRQALRSGVCSVVVGWLDRVDNALLRRLQLAVREAAIPLILFRPLPQAQHASPAALRLQLSARAAGVLRIDILKRRGAPANQPLYLQGAGFDAPPAMAPTRCAAPPALVLIA